MASTAYQTFFVPSSGRLGVVHTVHVFQDGTTDCSCEDATYRMCQCRHQRFVLTAWTAAGRSGTLIAQHTAQQVKAETGLSHTWAARDSFRCVCGYAEAVSIEALAAHVGAARRGERAAALAERYAAEHDRNEVYRITRAI